MASVDGSVAAYRVPALLHGGSLLVKQASHYLEHFYDDLRAGEHFVEFRADNSDLGDAVRWARAHDAEAETIAMAARSFAFHRLSAEQVRALR